MMKKMQNIPVPWNQFPELFQKFQVLTKFNVAFRNVLFGDGMNRGFEHLPNIHEALRYSFKTAK